MAIKLIHTKNLRWIDIVSPNEKDLIYLKENFDFHPLDFDDIVEPATRTKIDEYDSYHFVIMLFPSYNRESREVTAKEVDFFIGPDFLITIHDGSMRTLTNLVQSVQQYDTRRNQHLTKGPGFLLVSILEVLLKRTSPLLDRLNHEIGIAEKNVFDLGIETLEHLAQVKKAIITYRRINKMHKYVLEKLARSKKDYLKFPDSAFAMHNLVEYAENTWNMLSTDKESLESFEETNQSLSAHKMNDILRILTVFSVIIFLLTLLINILLFLGDVSHIGSWPYIVPATSALIAFVTLSMLLFFRKKNWL